MSARAEFRARVVTAVDRSNSYTRRSLAALKRARALVSWAIAVGALGVLSTLNSPALAVICGSLVALGIAVRINVSQAYDNALWARHQIHDLPDPGTFAPGQVVTLLAHPSPVGLEEPLLAEILADDGHDGTARIIAEPLHGAALVPHGRGPFAIAKGDFAKYHRKEGHYIGIWAKENAS
jgi:hypothetical protein